MFDLDDVEAARQQSLWGRSVPDYEEDFASNGNDYYAETAMSVPGPDYYKERRQVDMNLEYDRAKLVGEQCREESENQALRACERRTLPNGTEDKRLTAAECMRFWAEGMPDESRSSSTAHEKTHGGGHEMSMEGEVAAKAGPAEIKAKAAVREYGSEATTTNQTTGKAMTRRGDEGYERDCFELEKRTYRDAMRGKDPYAP